MNEFMCKNRHCGWIGKEILRAPHPFDEGETLYFCPQCKDYENLIATCDMEGCDKEAVAGVNAKDGYKRICSEHYTEYRQLAK